jgi:CDP-diacylglycerol--serine O-phosphatidyltransferase
MKKHIPNTLTLINLFCGSIAIPLVMMSFVDSAMILVFVCLIADLLDGMVARWLKVDSPLGVQLDSLADVISFGLLPGVIIFYLLQRYGTGDISVGWTILAFLIPASAALRLAKFNLDTRERTYFYGLPTPAGALFAFGLLWMLLLPSTNWTDFFMNPFILYSLIVALVVLYHLPIELPGFKGSRTAKGVILGICLISVVLFFLQKEIAIIVPAFLYVLVGLMHKIVKIY